MLCLSSRRYAPVHGRTTQKPSQQSFPVVGAPSPPSRPRHLWKSEKEGGVCGDVSHGGVPISSVGPFDSKWQCNAFEVASRVVKRETKGQQGSTRLGDCAPDSKNRSAFLYEREASTKVSRPGGVEGDGR